ncbi:MAG TPA: ABC transporter permease, partial [Steroidobacteraceae bacterium]|nr:ABC transporter permease [Steroidobacteraceae bacterium]
ALWQLGSVLKLLPPVLFPPPAQIVRTFADLTANGELWTNLRISLARVVGGFALGTSVGLALGVAMGGSRSVERLLGPVFHGFRQVPIYGWMPFLILWLGVGETFMVAFIAFGAFYPIVLNTVEGIRTVPENYVEVGRIFELRGPELFWRVILPAALPAIFTGIRLALGLSWMLVIAAEFLAANTGIGHMMAWSRVLLQSDVVVIGIAVVGGVGFVMDLLVRRLEARVLGWRVSTVME